MKKNDWILLLSVALYTYLFFEQTAGINFTIFNFALLAGLIVKDKSVLKSIPWKIAATGTLLTSLCVGYYGNNLSLTANIISLSLLSGLSAKKESSVFFSILFSIYSYCTAPFFLILDQLKKRDTAPVNESPNGMKRSFLIVVPLLMTLLFFFLYRASNPLFNEFSRNLNFDFISVASVLTVLSGLFLVYGFLFHRVIQPISEFDLNAGNELKSEQHTNLLFLGRTFTIQDELFTGKLVLALLNMLLLLVNILDINFMFISGKLPDGISYSAFVHQGIGTLILSIVIAIAIILFYFRSSINFTKDNKTLKLLAYLWIAQNAFMLISTSFRNELYIFSYGLTYKRIGVYAYLIATLFGLITTGIKIYKHKTSIFLFRINGWIFYVVLSFSCLLNWDCLITDFNINRTQRLDKQYLISMSYSNLPQLIELASDTAQRNDKPNNSIDTSHLLSQSNESAFEATLGEHFSKFVFDRWSKEWKSLCYEDYRIYADLIEIAKSKKINKLNLFLDDRQSLEPFKDFNSIQDLKLHNLYSIDKKTFDCFPNLKKLELESYQSFSLVGIEKLKNLEYLDVSKNLILNFEPIKQLRNLKELHVGPISKIQLEELQLSLSNTKINIH